IREGAHKGGGEERQQRQPKPPGLPDERGDDKAERRGSLVPEAIGVAGPGPEFIIPRGQTRINDAALGLRIRPIVVKTLELVLEVNVFGSGESQSGEINLEAAMA